MDAANDFSFPSYITKHNIFTFYLLFLELCDDSNFFFLVLPSSGLKTFSLISQIPAFKQTKILVKQYQYFTVEKQNSTFSQKRYWYTTVQ